MLCPRVEKIQDMDDPSKNVHGYLVQGGQFIMAGGITTAKSFHIIFSFSNLLMALLYMLRYTSFFRNFHY